MSAPETPRDALLGGIHACPRGLTCRPGRGILYPAPPQGAWRPEGPDVLLLGWNPRQAEMAHAALPPLDAWRREGEEGLARLARSGSPEARELDALLPPEHGLESGRTMRTWLWKWPTRVKTGGGESAFYAARCVASHLDAELALLRPRVLLTFHGEAADHVAARAGALGVEVRPPHPAVPRREALGWTLPSDAWGWPMGLVLLRDAAPTRQDATRTWARKAVEHVLAHTPPKA